MQCFRPVTAWQTVDGGIVFAERGKNLLREISLRCGQCIGCRLNAANAWAVRCYHEASMHEFNSFITLTYDDEHLPLHGSLNYSDFPLFMRKLRKRQPMMLYVDEDGVAKKRRKPIRFYMCGEYGENFGRPHYHALLFGHRFTDAVQANSINAKTPVFRSAMLEACWPHGQSSIGEVNMATAQYVAKYTLKKVCGDAAKDHYTRVNAATGEIVELMPEFARMSLKPGIGAKWFEAYGADIWNWDNVVVNGKVMPVPRYYDKLIEIKNPVRREEMQNERALRAQEVKAGPSLESMEKVAKARVQFYQEKTL